MKTCPECQRQFSDQQLMFQVGDSTVCAECKDDDTQRRTGCRFGTPETCKHQDCRL